MDDNNGEGRNYEGNAGDRGVGDEDMKNENFEDNEGSNDNLMREMRDKLSNDKSTSKDENDISIANLLKKSNGGDMLTDLLECISSNLQLEGQFPGQVQRAPRRMTV